jgi:Ca2+-binding RTX toxin-like protein
MFGSLIDAFGRFHGRRARAALLGGLIPACLAVGGLFPAASSAATRGFKVYNLSSYNLVYTGADGSGTIDSGPNPGGVITPGLGYHDFEETYYFLSDRVEFVRYQVVDGSGTRVGGLVITMAVDGYGSTTTFCDASGAGDCDVNGDVSTYRDDPGSVHNIPADQAQAQAATLRQLCNDNNVASCTFTPTKREPVDSPSHPVGNALINPYDGEQDTTVTVEDTVEATDSVEVGVEAGGKIFGVVEVSVSAKYGHEWRREHTFSQDVTVHCPGHTKCWITGVDPMLRDAGDFVLTLGNTTWYLRNVYFDSPNPNGQGSYQINEAPLTASELARLPQAVIQTGTDGNDNITGTNVDDRINAKPGNDTVSARAGDDVISGGSGNDHVRGGPGDDTINGGTGADSLAGGSGDDRINARDGKPDRVDCGGGHDSAALDSKDTITGATARNANGNCESVARN